MIAKAECYPGRPSFDGLLLSLIGRYIDGRYSIYTLVARVCLLRTRAPGVVENSYFNLLHDLYNPINSAPYFHGDLGLDLEVWVVCIEHREAVRAVRVCVSLILQGRQLRDALGQSILGLPEHTVDVQGAVVPAAELSRVFSARSGTDSHLHAAAALVLQHVRPAAVRVVRAVNTGDCARSQLQAFAARPVEVGSIAFFVRVEEPVPTVLRRGARLIVGAVAVIAVDLAVEIVVHAIGTVDLLVGVVDRVVRVVFAGSHHHDSNQHVIKLFHDIVPFCHAQCAAVVFTFYLSCTIFQ